MPAPSIRSPPASCRSRSGEATKTVPFVMDGRKVLRLHRRLGRRDRYRRRRGRVVESTEMLPDAVRDRGPAAALHRARSQQVPPRFSAIKIQGERAYDLARDGEIVELAGRARSRSTGCAGRTTTGNRTRARGGLRQGHLCARHRPRPRPRARLPRPRRGAAAHPRRALQRGGRGRASTPSRREPAALRARSRRRSRTTLDPGQPGHGGPPDARPAGHPARPRRAALRQDLRDLQRRARRGRRRRSAASCVPHRVFNWRSRALGLARAS